MELESHLKMSDLKVPSTKMFVRMWPITMAVSLVGLFMV